MKSKGSNFLNRMVACKRQDPMDYYKVWKVVILWKRYIEM